MKCIQEIRQVRKVKENRLKMNYPCRKCLPCLVTRRQEWTARLLLEMRMCLHTYYVTLTYDDENLPLLASLQKRDLQLYLKRLRKSTKSKLRYFASGEYGERKGRPHYHLLVFTNDEIAVEFGYCKERKKMCSIEGDFHKSWHNDDGLIGFVDVAYLPGVDDCKRVAAYVAGYVLKKIGKKLCLPGKEDEFQVMSRKPGIGFGYVERIANRLMRERVGPYGYDGVGIDHDLNMITIDGKLYPLSATFRKKLKDIWVQHGFGKPSDLSIALRQNWKALQNDILRDTEEYESQNQETRARAAQALKKYTRSRI